MQSYPQRMFQVKRKSLKCTGPRLEKKYTLLGFETGALRCWNLCETPTPPCHAEENCSFYGYSLLMTAA